MDRPIPGTIKIDGREFLYIENDDFKSFLDLFDKELFVHGSTPPPSGGGVIVENVSLVLPGNIELFGISYKGDIPIFRTKILDCCTELGLKWGALRDSEIELSSGVAFPLKHCTAKLWDLKSLVEIGTVNWMAD